MFSFITSCWHQCAYKLVRVQCAFECMYVCACEDVSLHGENRLQCCSPKREVDLIHTACSALWGIVNPACSYITVWSSRSSCSAKAEWLFTLSYLEPLSGQYTHNVIILSVYVENAFPLLYYYIVHRAVSSKFNMNAY